MKFTINNYYIILVRVIDKPTIRFLFKFFKQKREYFIFDERVFLIKYGPHIYIYVFCMWHIDNS
jgi:hypothetical protein